MSRKLFIVMAVLTLALAGTALAAVENIKVSGDIGMQGVSRNMQMEANKSSDSIWHLMDAQAYFLSQIRLRFDADLTENVSGTVRLINERLWGAEDSADTDIDLDLGFIEMKEFLYQPLTLIVGRQNLRYGNGFVVGDPDTNQTASSATPNETVNGFNNKIIGDLSLRKSFDAVRGILDFSPYTIDMVFANPVLGNTFIAEHVYLSGVNAAYQWGSYGGITEGYFWVVTNPHNIWLHNRGVATIQPQENQSITYTLGGRLQFNPIEKLTLGGEAGWQFGDAIVPLDNNTAGNLVAPYEFRHLNAGSVQLYGEYRFMTKYNPKVGAIYTFKSGDDDGHDYTVNGDATYNQWDPLFEDQTQGEIINILFANTNCHVVTLSGSLMPREDITLGLNWTWLALAQKDSQDSVTDNQGYYRPKVGPYRSNLYNVKTDENVIANEIDAYALYDYTEDVQIKVTGAWFMPGPYFDDANNGLAYSARAGLNLNF